jgi:ABC-type multidrug transport system ATPase subunit
MTEISKALIGRVRVLVLDEPTSALTSDEEQILFDAVRAVIAQGVGVMYVTHRLNEVFRISHSVTVLRDGVNVGTFNTAETDMKTLVAAIVGPKLAVAEARAAAEPRPLAKLEGTASAKLSRRRFAVPRARVEPGRERLAVSAPELALKPGLRRLRRNRRRRMRRLAQADRRSKILLKKSETEVPRKSRIRAHSVVYTGSCHSKA